jgi:hypothetical protein
MILISIGATYNIPLLFECKIFLLHKGGWRVGEVREKVFYNRVLMSSGDA